MGQHATFKVKDQTVDKAFVFETDGRIFLVFDETPPSGPQRIQVEVEPRSLQRALATIATETDAPNWYDNSEDPPPYVGDYLTFDGIETYQIQFYDEAAGEWEGDIPTHWAYLSEPA